MVLGREWGGSGEGSLTGKGFLSKNDFPKTRLNQRDLFSDDFFNDSDVTQTEDAYDAREADADAGLSQQEGADGAEDQVRSRKGVAEVEHKFESECK